MANLIIKPTSGGSLILQDEGGTAANTIDASGNTQLAGTLGVTGNTTLSGTANNLGTVTAGTISTGVVMDDPTMTQGSDATGDIYYRAADGKLTRLPTTADGHLLTSTGVGAVPAWEAPAASAAKFTHIETVTTSSASNIHIQDCFTTTYKSYLLTLNNYVPSTDATDTKIYFSLSGTTNTQSYYWYVFSGYQTGGATYFSTARDVGFVYLSPNTANDDGGASGHWILSNAKDTDGFISANGVLSHAHGGTYYVGGSHSFGFRANNGFDGIMFAPSSGNVDNGAMLSVYGITQS